MADWYKKKYGHVKEDIDQDYCPDCIENPCACNNMVEEKSDVPFDPPYKKSSGVVTDKSGAKHGPMSIARDLARKALKKQSDAIKPKQTMAKESLDESRKTDIVKEAFKKAKKKNDDTFQPEPELGSTVVKADN